MAALAATTLLAASESWSKSFAGWVSSGYDPDEWSAARDRTRHPEVKFPASAAQAPPVRVCCAISPGHSGTDLASLCCPDVSQGWKVLL